MNRKPERKRIDIDLLHSFYLQGHFYETLPKPELERLAADLAERGQLDPIRVLPERDDSGQIVLRVLDGHNRIEAIKLNGGRDVDAQILWDLMDADPAAIESKYLSFNATRRQLPLLDQAAVLFRQLEIEHGLPMGGLRDGRLYQEAKARLAVITGKSGRHLSRLFRILMLPRELQKKVRDGLLDQVVAEKIKPLDRRVQEQLAKAVAPLSDKCEITALVKRHLPAPVPRPFVASRTCKRWLKGMTRDLPRLEAATARAYAGVFGEHVETLQKTKRLIDLMTRAAAKHNAASVRSGDKTAGSHE